MNLSELPIGELLISMDLIVAAGKT